MENKTYNVLVVDDDKSTRKLLQTIFNNYDKFGKVQKTANFDVQTAVDGEDAAAKLESGPYDIVILDVMMQYRELPKEFIQQSQVKCSLVEYPYLLDLCQKAWTKNPNANVGLYSSKEESILEVLANALGVNYYPKKGNIGEIAKSHIQRMNSSSK